MDPPLMTTTTTSKLRLICSYGGKIIPRPQSKSLYYSGGENRMVTIPTATIATLTLSSLTSHLSTFLNIASPFVLKYQLPNHELDSLISVSTDEDLQIMLEEHLRVSSAANPSRIRLFLFPVVVESVKTELSHPKRESWFDDALRSARVGFGGEINSEHESVVLETSSSFGSTSSSLSLSNLHPIKASSDSIRSDEYVGSAVSNVQNGACPDLVDLTTILENQVSAELFESENKIVDPSSSDELHKPIQASGFDINIMDPSQQQTQFLLDGPHYLEQNMPGSQQVAPYYTVYHPLPHQQPLHYQSNQQYPLYYLPVVPTRPYNMPTQYGMVQASSICSGQLQSHPNVSFTPPQQVTKEVAVSPQPLAELSTSAYKNVPGGNPITHVPYTEKQTRFVGVQIQHQPQAFGVADETTNYTNKSDDDPARVQIYKSQPPPLMFSSQHHAMTQASALILPEPLAQLHTDNTTQHMRTSEPK